MPQQQLIHAAQACALRYSSSVTYDRSPMMVGYGESGTVTDIRRIGVAARYSDLVIHEGTAYFSGYVPETTLDLSASEQTRDILGQIEESLTQIGSDKSKLLQATIWLADMAFYDEMNAVWDAWVVPEQAPARVCVEARLADPDYKLEIQVIAAL